MFSWGKTTKFRDTNFLFEAIFFGNFDTAIGLGLGAKRFPIFVCLALFLLFRYLSFSPGDWDNRSWLRSSLSFSAIPERLGERDRLRLRNRLRDRQRLERLGDLRFGRPRLDRLRDRLRDRPRLDRPGDRLRDRLRFGRIGDWLVRDRQFNFFPRLCQHLKAKFPPSAFLNQSVHLKKQASFNRMLHWFGNLNRS